MSFTREELLHLAKLARIQVDESKLEALQAQLDAIFGYVDRLQTVQTTAVMASDDASLQAVVRSDEPQASSPGLLDALHGAFPDRAGALLRVPGVFDKPKD
jgi:aspartyl-tRNA(Asn)/glutamyl-tRNA(Gln) amidotransferase subunit C